MQGALWGLSPAPAGGEGVAKGGFVLPSAVLAPVLPEGGLCGADACVSPGGPHTHGPPGANTVPLLSMYHPCADALPSLYCPSAIPLPSLHSSSTVPLPSLSHRFTVPLLLLCRPLTAALPSVYCPGRHPHGLFERSAQGAAVRHTYTYTNTPGWNTHGPAQRSAQSADTHTHIHTHTYTHTFTHTHTHSHTDTHTHTHTRSCCSGCGGLCALMGVTTV
jgi:hypothetical protein